LYQQEQTKGKESNSISFAIEEGGRKSGQKTISAPKKKEKEGHRQR